MSNDECRVKSDFQARGNDPSPFIPHSSFVTCHSSLVNALTLWGKRLNRDSLAPDRRAARNPDEVSTCIAQLARGDTYKLIFAGDGESCPDLGRALKNARRVKQVLNESKGKFVAGIDPCPVLSASKRTV